MKAAELRIGNWYRWKSIASMGRGEAQITHGQQIMDYIDFKEGIPITEEWLLRSGFILNTSTDLRKLYTIEMDTNYQLGFCDYQIAKIFATGFIALTVQRIEYVHQLQNLYFDLKGEELQIKEGSRLDSPPPKN